MDQYAGSPGHGGFCFADLTASFINFFHYCSLSSGFYGAGKVTEADALTVRLESGCHRIWTIGAPIFIIPPFLC